MSDILDEREKTHGSFAVTALIAQELKGIVRRGLASRNAGQPLSWAQQECLEAICLKMARIISGDPNFPDHWRDIRGYASDRLVGIDNSEGMQ